MSTSRVKSTRVLLFLLQTALFLFIGISLIIKLPGNVYASYTCTGGGDHGGANWDPATDCPGGIAGTHTNIGTLTINSSETATVQAYNGSSFGSVAISATSASISGTFTANGGGYAGGTNNGNGAGPGGGTGNGGVNVGSGGAGYGSTGGNGNSGIAGGTPYGSLTAPVDLGSGGGAQFANVGGAGGGAIKINATGTVTINGTISANGVSPGGWAGGGAGGSIYIASTTLAGNGSITANGGIGPGNGGGGSGGRIAIYYSTSDTYSGTTTATGGSGANAGGNGTNILVDSTNNDLYINKSQTWNASPSLEGSTFSYHAVTIQNNATLTLAGYYTTNSNGIGQTFNVANFTVSSGAAVSANSGGYAGGTNNGNGAGPAGGIGCNCSGAGGGGYGGGGGVGNGAAAGGTYGSFTAPVNLGSGGGAQNTNGVGGSGGGAIKINATGTITVAGTITTNGGDGNTWSGGGAGGSIWLVAPTIAGSGTITANGGNGTAGGGSGGGGRIYLSHSSSFTYGGTISDTAGATGAHIGTNGTNVLYDSTNNDIYIKSSQTWNANPSLEGSSFTYHNVAIQNNSTLSLIGYYTTNSNGVGQTFTVANFTINSGSSVAADSGGYAGGTNNGNGTGPGGGIGCNCSGAGGGSYGGSGGNGSGEPAGVTYGSLTVPVDLGSGGGAQNTNGVGGSGGGAIKVSATGTITINGTISSNGGAGNTWSGGGSGGTIYLTAPTLAGSGTITANGGSGTSGGGGGGGGRIALFYSSSNAFNGSVTATGAGGANTGTNGTNVLVDSTHNDLYINTSQTWNANPSLEGQSFTYHNITLQNNSTLSLIGYYTTNSNGVGQTFNVANFTIASGSALSANGGGYAGGAGGSPGTNGSGPGGGLGSSGWSGGGGYGGAGGTGTSAGGGTYGSASAPVDLGSGGGGGGSGSAGGAGGGAIHIIASNTLSIGGTLSANGANAPAVGGGGGSGGSLYLSVCTLSGAGTIQTNGGNAGNGSGGNGGGGRIAIFYSCANNWSGNSLTPAGATTPGSGGNGGANGTVVLQAQGNPVITSLTQYKSDCITTIATAGVVVGSSGVCFGAVGSDSLTPDTLTLQIEIQPNGTAFTNVATLSTNLSYNGSPVTFTDLYTAFPPQNKAYHWQARIVDAEGYATSWTVMGGSPDFSIDHNTPTVSNLGPANLVNGSYTAQNKPTLTFMLADADNGDTTGYEIQIATSISFASPVVDNVSALATPGNASFTVGQSGGTYITGSSGQTLEDGSYYWRVKSVDNWGISSPYSTANAGSFAFAVDTTVPSVPGTPLTTSPTNNTTPTWTWIASTDSGSGLAATPYTFQWCNNNSFAGCSGNTGTASTNSFTHPSSLAYGTWYTRVNAVDKLGNVSAYSPVGLAVIEDTVTTPGTPITTTPTNNSKPTWTWSASTSSGAGTIAYTAQWCGNNTFTNCGTNTATTNSPTYTQGSALTDGIWYMRVQATDSFGGVSSYSQTGSVLIDTTPPTVPGTPAPNETPTKDRLLTWTWDPSVDYGSGLGNPAYQVQWCDNHNFTGCGSDVGTSTTNSFTQPSNLHNGTWYLEVRSVDAAGNVSAFSNAGKVEVTGSRNDIGGVTPTQSPTASVVETPSISPTPTRGNDHEGEGNGNVFNDIKTILPQALTGALTSATGTTGIVGGVVLIGFTDIGTAYTGFASLSIIAAEFLNGLLSLLLDLPLQLMRLVNLFMEVLGFKQKPKPWGVLYDALTKQPVDPAIITLFKKEGETYVEVETRIPDFQGRFGFLVDTGTYAIKVTRQNYSFPSKRLAGATTDGDRNNLYFGGDIAVENPDLINVNIPLDPLNYDWNQENKPTSYKKHFIGLNLVKNIVFTIGIVLSAVIYIIKPTTFNLIVFLLYPITFIFGHVLVKRKKWGIVYDEETHETLPHVTVKAVKDITGHEITEGSVITDRLGRYYLILNEGTHYLNAEGSEKGILATVGPISVGKKRAFVCPDISV